MQCRQVDQRKGPAVGGGGVAENDWAEGGGDFACAGATRDGGGDDMTFCLISCSIACIVTRFWSICSCLAATCSTLRRTAARSRAMGASCCTNSRDGAVPAVVVESGNNQPSDGARILTISFALSPLFRQTDVATTPIRIATEIRARGPNMRLPIDGLLLAIRLFLTRGGRGRPERTGGSIGRVPPRRSNMGSRSRADPPGQPPSAADLGTRGTSSSRSRRRSCRGGLCIDTSPNSNSTSIAGVAGSSRSC
jgi:hypothetical protein